jgi:hypothetical protein
VSLQQSLFFGHPRQYQLLLLMTSFLTAVFRIKAYIESQKWDEDDHRFKITAPAGPD